MITGLIGAKLVKEMERVPPNSRQKLILDGAGHWIQQERPGRGQCRPDHLPEGVSFL